MGGLFAVFLVVMLVVCCVWYQVFRAQVDDSHKEKGAFNLAEMRTDATNQTAVEINTKEMEMAPPGKNGDTVKQDLSAGKTEGTQL